MHCGKPRTLRVRLWSRCLPRESLTSGAFLLSDVTRPQLGSPVLLLLLLLLLLR